MDHSLCLAWWQWCRSLMAVVTLLSLLAVVEATELSSKLPKYNIVWEEGGHDNLYKTITYATNI